MDLDFRKSSDQEEPTKEQGEATTKKVEGEGKKVNKYKIFPLKVQIDERDGKPNMKVLFMYDKRIRLSHSKDKGYPCIWVPMEMGDK